MIYDAAVIGAGTAGLAAALRMAEGGLKVIVYAKGVGSTHLTGGTIDVLGYTPHLVEHPETELPSFVDAHPDHPYARLSVATINDALGWFRGRMTTYDYTGNLAANLMLPTAAGAPKPSALVPETMAAGDLRGGGRFVIVGFTQLKDFYPAYLADNLSRFEAAPGLPVNARSVTQRAPIAQADVTPLSFARHFEDAEFRKAVIAGLEREVGGSDAVGFPAVLGLGEARTVCQELQDGLGLPVFEVPTLPPSVPGMRMFNALKRALSKAGGTVVMGGPALGADATGERVEALVTAAAARTRSYRARHFVLATGGFASGGIVMDSTGAVKESVLGLPVAGVPPTGEERFSPGYWASHPMARAGVAVDDALRPVDADGDVLYANVRIAGAAIAGAEPWREKSGEGITLATGYAAASSILESDA